MEVGDFLITSQSAPMGGELSICTIDQVWAEFAEQIKAVREGKDKLKMLEAKIEHEMEVNELMADSFERMVSEYKWLLQQQRTF